MEDLRTLSIAPTVPCLLHPSTRGDTAITRRKVSMASLRQPVGRLVTLLSPAEEVTADTKRR